MIVAQVQERLLSGNNFSRRDLLIASGNLALVHTSALTSQRLSAAPQAKYQAPPRHIMRTYAEDLGVVGGSQGNAVRNAAILGAALAQGRIIYLKPAELYNIAHIKGFASDSGLVCEGDNKAVLRMPATVFSNNQLKSYGPTAVGLLVDGRTDAMGGAAIERVRLENFGIRSDELDGRFIRGLAIRNAANLHVLGVEISGLPCGIGLTLSGITGASQIDVHIHDFFTSHMWEGSPQSTAIEVDNEHISGAASVGIQFLNLHIENISFGAELSMARGDQTDGITLCSDNGGHIVRQYYIRNVGEAIDCQTKGCRFLNGRIVDAREAAFKFVHGASSNEATNIDVRNVGRWGIVFAGSPNAHVGDTEGNIIRGGSIRNLNYQRKFDQRATTGAVVLIDNGGEKTGNRPVENKVSDLDIFMGVSGIYGWNDESTEGPNYGDNIRIAPGLSKVDLLRFVPGASKVKLRGQRFYRTSTYSG